MCLTIMGCVGNVHRYNFKLFEGRLGPTSSLCYKTSLKYISKGFDAAKIKSYRKTHAGRVQEAKDLQSGG